MYKITIDLPSARSVANLRKIFRNVALQASDDPALVKVVVTDLDTIRVKSKYGVEKLILEFLINAKFTKATNSIDSAELRELMMKEGYSMHQVNRAFARLRAQGKIRAVRMGRRYRYYLEVN